MKTLVRTFTVLAASAALSLPCLAQEEDDPVIEDVAEESSEASAETAAEADGSGDEQAAATEAGKNKNAERYFTSLPFCSLLEGTAEVLKPGSKTWVPVEEGLYYPMGTSYRTTDANSKLEIRFNPLLADPVTVTLNSAASFSTRAQALGERTRTIILRSGTIDVKLPRNLPDGLFTVVSQGFSIVNPKGESRIAYIRNTDGEAAQIRCVTGTLAIEGRHFKLPEVKTASEVKIRTSQDLLFTGLYGNRGDSLVLLDQGFKQVKNYATGEIVVDKKPLEWKLSPRTAVRIHRAMPSIGERMSVTVMTFDASGNLKNRCAFTEGRDDVNTGEIGPIAKRDREALAKQAAEAAETVAVEVEEEDEEDSGSSSGSGDGQDDSGESGGDDADFDF